MFTLKTCAHCEHQWLNGSHCPICGGPRIEEDELADDRSPRTTRQPAAKRPSSTIKQATY